MILKRFDGVRGRVEVVEHESSCLAGNPLGDPTRRQLGVYLPAGYDDGDDRYPVLFCLAGFTGSGLYHLAWRNFTENLPERLDRLIHTRKMGPAIVVLPDCFTALGGNQYIDSTALGPYATYLTRELVSFVDGRFRTLASPKHRGVFGKSSGGYGAIIHAMRYPDVWGAAACHSGDMYFEFGYLAELPRVLDTLARHDHSVEKFLAAFHQKQKPSSDDVHTLMFIAMAASYDPDPQAPLGFHMPCDLRTGRVDPERWQRWLRYDPVHLVDECAAALHGLSLLYIDCGWKDQYHLHYGSRQLVERLAQAGIRHHYEEFEDNHSSVDYRLDLSLPMLVEALAPR